MPSKKTVKIWITETELRCTIEKKRWFIDFEKYLKKCKKENYTRWPIKPRGTSFSSERRSADHKSWEWKHPPPPPLLLPPPHPFPQSNGIGDIEHRPDSSVVSWVMTCGTVQMLYPRSWNGQYLVAEQLPARMRYGMSLAASYQSILSVFYVSPSAKLGQTLIRAGPLASMASLWFPPFPILLPLLLPQR